MNPQPLSRPGAMSGAPALPPAPLSASPCGDNRGGRGQDARPLGAEKPAHARGPRSAASGLALAAPTGAPATKMIAYLEDRARGLFVFPP